MAYPTSEKVSQALREGAVCFYAGDRFAPLGQDAGAGSRQEDNSWGGVEESVVEECSAGSVSFVFFLYFSI